MPKLTQDQIEFHIKRKGSLISNRSNFDSHWQEIAERSYPEHAQFNTQSSPGEKQMSKIYDSVGILSNQLLASGLFSLLTSSANQWFQLMPVDLRWYDIYEIAAYLDEISRIMYHEINKPSAGFSTSMHEGYLGYGAFGNMTIFADELLGRDSLLFNALPLFETYYVENNEGRVDTLYRNYQRTVLHLATKFGVQNLSTDTQKLYIDKKFDKKIDCTHIIMPRRDTDIMSPLSIELPFASIYLEDKMKHSIMESGYHEMPMMAARFYKSAHEHYGRGPGNTALPDTKMLMRVNQVTIRSAQKTTDPPILLPHSGFLRPLKTSPSGLNYYRRGRINLKTDIDILPTGNPGFGVEYIEFLRKSIREIFFVDQLQLHEGPQMTATEVIQRTEEKLRLMGPLLGRLQTELLGPLIKRVHGLLDRAGKFPEPPEAIANMPLKITYTSPIARAQEQVEANGLMRSIEILKPLMDLKPEMLDIFNTDEMTRGVFDMFSVSKRFINSEKDVKNIRAARAEAEAKKQQAENLRAAGQGADSLARAADTAGIDLTGGDFGILQ